MRPHRGARRRRAVSAGSCPAGCALRLTAVGRWKPYSTCPACGTGSHVTSPEPYWEEAGEPSPAQRAFWNSRQAQWRIVSRPAGARVLDVGCGLGYFVDWATRQGYDAVGVEPVPWAVENTVAPGRVVSSLAETEGRFDVITLWDVLEHVPEPLGFLLDLVPRLGPGGTVLVGSPDFLAIQLRWPYLVRSPDRFEAWVQPDQHCTQFTRRGLSWLLERVGLATITSHHPPVQRLPEPWDRVLASLPGLRRGLFVTGELPPDG